MCPTGEATSRTSLVSSPNLPDSALLQAISEFDVCATPFGSPVVPDVNIRTAMSSTQTRRKFCRLGSQQLPLEIVIAFAVDHDHVLEIGEIGSHALCHRRVVETA